MRGFTLVEIIVVIAIIGILATLVIVRYAGKTDQAKVAVAKSQVVDLESACTMFQANCSRWPNSLEELVKKPSDCSNWQDGGYLKGTKVPKDPWGHEFVFKNEGGKIEIISLGADGQQGGSGYAADISSLSVDETK